MDLKEENGRRDRIQVPFHTVSQESTKRLYCWLFGCLGPDEPKRVCALFLSAARATIAGVVHFLGNSRPRAEVIAVTAGCVSFRSGVIA